MAHIFSDKRRKNQWQHKQFAQGLHSQLPPEIRFFPLRRVRNSSLVEPMDRSKTALVLIEFQDDFITEGAALHGAVKEIMEKTGNQEFLGNLDTLAVGTDTSRG